MRGFKGLLLRSVALAGLAAVSLGSGAAGAMSLKEAVELAITTNPDVGSVANDRRAIDEELRQGRALYLPQIDVRGATGPEYSDNATTQAENRDHRTLWRKEASATLSQLLFDGFFADSEVEKQIARVESAAHRVNEASEFTGLDAVEAFLEVLRHRARVDIAEGNVKVHRQRLDQVRTRAEAGGGNIADVRQAEARLSNAESSLNQVRGDLRDAEALFIRVVGQAPDTLDDPTVPVEAIPADVETAVAMAIENSPTVQFARADVKAAEADVKQQNASLYPDIRLELGGSANDDIDGRDGDEYDATALVVLRYNLYRGGADVARIREFKYRQAEALDILRKNERKVAEDTRVSWNAMEVSRNNVEILRREVEANERTRDVYKQQFEIGQRGLLDLLDADNELFLARDSLVTAEFTEMFANYRLLASQGSLQKALGLTPIEAANPQAAEHWSIFE
jgi:adhesin transport system outer membrane protein